MDKAPSRVRVKLARMIEKEMLDQHGIVVEVDPVKSFSIASGFYRTSEHADTYRWTCSSRIPGLNVGPMIDSYDTMTECGRYGFVLQKDARRASTFEATARNKN